MPDRTKIVFSSGRELEVDEEPSQVMDALTRNEPFHRFKKTTAGTDVDAFVLPDQVAYTEQVPEPSTGAPITTPRPSPYKIDGPTGA